MVKERDEGSVGGVKRRCLQSSGGLWLEVRCLQSKGEGEVTCSYEMMRLRKRRGGESEREGHATLYRIINVLTFSSRERGRCRARAENFNISNLDALSDEAPLIKIQR